MALTFHLRDYTNLDGRLPWQFDEVVGSEFGSLLSELRS